MSSRVNSLAKRINEKKAKSLSNVYSQKKVSMSEIRQFIEEEWDPSSL
ncbi:MAG: hypothetical protein QXZ17_12675 [Nitrososphaerota archaeon]